MIILVAKIVQKTHNNSLVQTVAIKSNILVAILSDLCYNIFLQEATMPATFLVSDTHFGHNGVCHFMRNDGVTKLRPWDTAEEMDEEMVKRWNERVKPSDKVYHLGDVVINRKALGIMRRLNGDKVLIRGNHDIFRDNEYSEHFRELRAYHVLNGMILSHIPVHAASLGRFGTNIHGHLHSNRVMQARGVDARTGEILYSNKVDVRYAAYKMQKDDMVLVERYSAPEKTSFGLFLPKIEGKDQKHLGNRIVCVTKSTT
jgi:calcineurin-like phosphoesterase family protein